MGTVVTGQVVLGYIEKVAEVEARGTSKQFCFRFGLQGPALTFFSDKLYSKLKYCSFQIKSKLKCILKIIFKNI